MTLAAWGNDGVFYVNGNQLVPIQETDIALAKEVLTMTTAMPRSTCSFSRFWWYMPDPSWKPSTDDFTPREWKLINQGE